MSIVLVLVQLIFGQPWWDIMSRFSDITKKASLTANSIILWLLHFSHHSVSDDPWAVGSGDVFVTMDGDAQLSISVVCSFL